jgi:serine protease Do
MGTQIRNIATLALAGSLIASVATACQSSYPTAAGPRPVILEAGPSPAEPPSAEAFGSVIRRVAQRVQPSVVQITSQQVQLDRANHALTVPAGVGSGVIYDDQGHILTNNHVVDGASSLLVSLPDGRSFPATLVGRDPQTDLAVVQVAGSDLPVAELGDSQQLQVGDWVVAIGNALALSGGPTVTTGVVGALNRTVQEPGDSPKSQGPFLFDLIQTDAPINPGNSGGPLVNLSGQVIGINTLVAGQAEPGVQTQGIGFAISMSVARAISDKLVAQGEVVHPFLGIQYAPLNPAIAAQAGLDITDGTLIIAIAPGSPAAQAGLRARDVITQVDGAAVQGDSGLARIVESHMPGDTLSFSVHRGGQITTVPVTLARMPS